MSTAGSPSSEEGGKRLGGVKILAFVVFGVGVAVDLVSKGIFERMLQMDPGSDGPYRPPIDLIPGFFALEGTYNRGVTFGLAPGHTEVVLDFTLVASLALTAWLLATRRPSILLHVSLGMVLAGAIGNLYDRFHWHKVRDFFLIYTGDLQSPSFKWPNFNVADSLIVVGVILILWQELFGRDRKPFIGRRPKPGTPDSGAGDSSPSRSST